jgi:D-3-phosphoglycerate dehydrogenase
MIDPIHHAGLKRLADHGVEVCHASARDMDTVALEIVNADAVITRGSGLSKQAVTAARRLKVIGSHGVGVDAVDVAAASERRIPVINTPLANYQSVAEHVVMLAFAVARQVIAANQAARAGDTTFKFSGKFHELCGKTLGIIGMGRIGNRVAEICIAALGMRVIFYSPTADAAAFARRGMTKLEKLHDLLALADIISINVPLTAATRGMIGRNEFAHMKQDAIFINTSRGDVVVEAELIKSLRDGRLSGAGLDVMSRQSTSGAEAVGQSELARLPNVVMTPHIAASTEECLERTAMQTVEQVLDVLAGRRPQHLVNPQIWDERQGR